MAEAKVERVPLKVPRLLEEYRKTIRPKLQEEFKIKNAMAAPRVEKIVINMGVKEGQTDIKILEQIQSELARIAGQQPVMTRAKKSISAFKLREGAPVGLKVTLRRYRMYEFMDRFFNIACPRIRDFRGFSPKSFDQNANYSVGLQEQIVFPEVEFDKVKKMQGMDITFVTTATKVDQARRLLELLGIPFRK